MADNTIKTPSSDSKSKWYWDMAAIAVMNRDLDNLRKAFFALFAISKKRKYAPDVDDNVDVEDLPEIQ